MSTAGRIEELPELRDLTGVFKDRTHAARELARLLEPARVRGMLVLAIPAGGLEVGAGVAGALGLELEAAVVSKITLPRNTEVGYGAVAFDGTVLLNDPVIRGAALTQAEVEQGIRQTREKVARRVRRFRAGGLERRIARRGVILVDDGLASGFTMRTAVEAARKAGAGPVCVAVPTGHADAVRALAAVAGTVLCANVRGGFAFAVADAYMEWRDVPEEEAARILQTFREAAARRARQ